jgi:hypothetical protein
MGFKWVYCLVFLILFFSCHSGKGKSDDKFVEVYGEVLLLSEKFSNDSLLLKTKIDSLLKAKKMSYQEFDSLSKVYSENPKRWVEFFDKVKKYIDEKSSNASHNR